MAKGYEDYKMRHRINLWFMTLFFFDQTRVSQALAQINPSARVTRPPQASCSDEEEGQTPNLVSNESMPTAPPGPLGWFMTLCCNLLHDHCNYFQIIFVPNNIPFLENICTLYFSRPHSNKI
jgi:hypothetical protein